MSWLTYVAPLLIAQAEAPAKTGGGFESLLGMAPLVLMFGVLYFLVIRPASKQRKEHQKLLTELKKDDEVVTAAGFYGRIITLEDTTVTLEIADKVKIRMLRDRIAGRWVESTPKV